MRLQKFISILSIGGLVLLNGCSTSGHGANNQNGGSYGQDGSMGSTGGARASGIGQGAQFSDQNANQLLTQRVYYFDFDSSVINEQYKPALFASADYLMSHPHTKIIIEGHTDPRGSREYNVALGERRANAVEELLTMRGVNPTQIRVVSYGAERLAAMGHTEQDFQKDRRAVIVKMQG